ncbi:Glycoside hydrolase family 57 [Verrucomicrobia bacterium]|nr:Glycoside hydrolase family 57 [Verrucomicrobiota bacterium]
MEKFICVHGHFYQPPRENPWLESIELQDSAAPYHDWNERLAVECYAPNAAARILDGEGRIEEIVSNYSKISFNFGPTLLAWMREKLPEVHDAIVAADRLSAQNFSGHGSALAQVYNHMILPLANSRDKYTQVLWGIRDFEHRFGRQPEGMWLSETAADTETLETLAQLGIRFTILAPSQASRMRELGKRNWRDVNGGQIDPTRPYLVRLPSKRNINVFFYDGPISRAIAFEHLLTSGERFAQRLVGAFNDQRSWDQLVHIATDGESYGHHHRHGEMALAYALHYIQSHNLARLTNYGEYLEKHPPQAEAQIHEKTAWSCVHGVGRWMADCGCNSGGHPGWNQRWRTPLRESLDWLRDELAPAFETRGGELLRDPWAARNDYIGVIHDRSPESRERFFAQHARRELNEPEQVTVLKLMEMQRHAMLMYTSCGWFFDEVSGLESVQVVQYAARALQLAGDVLGKDLEAGFLDRFQAARSNLPENQDGRVIYGKFVKPARIDWTHAMAHYGISSLFKRYSERTRIFSFCFEDEHRQVLEAGKSRLAIGRAKVTSLITQESQVLSYTMLHIGEHNVTGGVKRFDSIEAYDAMFAEVKAAYEGADFPQTIRLIDRHFGQAAYSLTSLFRDEQRRILNDILASTREDLESRFRLITERYAPLMKFLESTGAPWPPALGIAAELVLHSDLRRELDSESLDVERLRGLLAEAQIHGSKVLDADISFAVKNKMERLMERLAADPQDADQMRNLEQLATGVVALPLGLNLWKVQNTYWGLLKSVLPAFEQRAAEGDESARGWLKQFIDLGSRLGFATNNRPVQAAELKAAA